MAGAGYKVFADGDVLTAAQVQTYLQDQAVMRFADSSARTTALGTAVAEGMLSYLDDVNEVQVYDGSAWGSVGNVLSIASANFTGTQTISTSPSSFTDIDDLSITVTPRSASSKFRIIAVVYASNIIANGRSAQKFRIERDGTEIEEWASYLTASDTNGKLFGYTLSYEDAPATTSAITYTVSISQSATASATTVYVNRNEANTRNAASFLTVEEYV